MICCLRGLWTPVKLCPLLRCPNLLPSVCPSRSCCCLSTRGSNTTSMGTGRPTLSVRWEFRGHWTETETFGSNMSKSGRWLTQEGTKCLMCAVMQCCRAPGSQGCCSVSLRWDRISCHDQCYREVMFLWLYIEILVVDMRTYELLKEPLFDFWMINRSKPSSEPWRARGQHLIKSTDEGAVHTFHYF